MLNGILKKVLFVLVVVVIFQNWGKIERVLNPSGVVSEQTRASARVVLYTVLLDVDNTDQVLMPEMTTQVFFVSGQAQDVLLAPIIALQASTEGDRQTARIVAKNGKLQLREIRTGISDRLRVEILDGLNEGDRLLIGPATGNGG